MGSVAVRQHGWGRLGDPGTTPLGVTVPVGVVLVVATLLIGAAAWPREEELRFGLLVAAVGSVAVAVGDLLPAALVAAAAWMFFDGFVVGDFGVLAWHGRADLVRVVVLLLAAAPAGVGRLRRRRAARGGVRTLERFANQDRPPGTATRPVTDRRLTGPAQPPPEESQPEKLQPEKLQPDLSLTGKE